MEKVIDYLLEQIRKQEDIIKYYEENDSDFSKNIEIRILTKKIENAIKFMENNILIKNVNGDYICPSDIDSATCSIEDLYNLLNE